MSADNRTFEDRVRYLARNIPPDDIYPFAQKTIMGMSYFANKYQSLVDDDAINADPTAVYYLKNLMKLLVMQKYEMDLEVNLGLGDDDNQEGE